jgi:predicted dinucleotide-binding enzyme
MKIGIVGAGRMGRALGRRWARAGHDVAISFSRDQKKLEKVAREMGKSVRAATPTDAVSTADAILVAVHWSTLDEALGQAGALTNKVVLSCTLPMNEDDSALVLGHTTSGAEELARRSGAPVVAIFNTVTSELITNDARMARVKPDVVYCGDEDAAKSTAAKLARDAGFNPIDAGALRIARYIEPFGLLVAQLAYDQELGETMGYRFLFPVSR